MESNILISLKNQKDTWHQPEIIDMNSIPKGDMPNDKVNIGKNHVLMTSTIFPVLLDKLAPLLGSRSQTKAVIAVHGGSGVGKSEVGSLLAYYLNCIGIGAYILSGDNYPHRIPCENDQERMRVFREFGIKGLVADGLFTKEKNEILLDLQATDLDTKPSLSQEYPWLESYHKAGKQGLEDYLGTPKEIDFFEVNQIINNFKAGNSVAMLKRMGRVKNELWYDQVDMSHIQVMVIEWTHGNSVYLKGVDIPILLNSTPMETLEHRRLRNRDGAVDSPFTTMVLEIEQKLLVSQAHTAKIIVAKNGELIGWDHYRELMNIPGGKHEFH